jgi:hypothetical protein
VVGVPVGLDVVGPGLGAPVGVLLGLDVVLGDLVGLDVMVIQVWCFSSRFTIAV